LLSHEQPCSLTPQFPRLAQINPNRSSVEPASALSRGWPRFCCPLLRFCWLHLGGNTEVEGAEGRPLSLAEVVTSSSCDVVVICLRGSTTEADVAESVHLHGSQVPAAQIADLVAVWIVSLELSMRVCKFGQGSCELTTPLFRSVPSLSTSKNPYGAVLQRLVCTPHFPADCALLSKGVPSQSWNIPSPSPRWWAAISETSWVS
jgi:hypothetical protein